MNFSGIKKSLSAITALGITAAFSGCMPGSRVEELRSDAITQVKAMLFIGDDAVRQLETATSRHEIEDILEIANRENTVKEQRYWDCALSLPPLEGDWFVDAIDTDGVTMNFYQLDLAPDGTASTAIIASMEAFRPLPTPAKTAWLSSIVDRTVDWESDLDEVIAYRTIPESVRPAGQGSDACEVFFTLTVDQTPKNASLRTENRRVWLTFVDDEFSFAADTEQ